MSEPVDGPSFAQPKFILASRSPQRIKLLKDAGYAFDIQPADIDEEKYAQNLLPSEIVLYLAREKAKFVADQVPQDVVLAADTVVAFGDHVLGKPRDATHATEMITLLAGTTHIVITGVAVVCRRTGFERSTRVMSAVRMRELSHAQIARYVQSNEWAGKAGGYGIQNAARHAGLAAGDPFIQCTAGSESNIVGLPIRTARKLLEAAGVFSR